ncbi:MAG: deoxynucleoside kinase [Chloroflexi bacterium]|nr:deoxynucleoside kinase [Chloroflexota bacterium]
MSHIAVEGCIASGKTTLAKALALKFHIDPVLEDYHDVPSLKLFYNDPETHAFETEIQFTQSHFKRLGEAIENSGGTPFVTDFTLKRDLLFAGVTLECQPEKLAEYQQFWMELANQLPEPDRIILLEAPVDELMKRIKQRGRPFEQGISEAYLKRLVSGLRDIYGEVPEGTVIKLESTELSELLEALPDNLVG